MVSRQKIALVTGASAGIGYQTALELAKRGYKVYAGARRTEPMKPLEKYGITILKLDVTSLESIRNAKAIIDKETDGYLDILYNNAGIYCGTTAYDLEDEVAKKCFEVNVFGPMKMVKEFHPLVIKAKGLLAFTGSTAALVAVPLGSVYAASKGAIHSYINNLALESEPFGVKVLNFVAGAVQTDISNASEKFQPPEGSVWRIDGKSVFPEDSGIDINRMTAAKFAVKAVNDFETALNSSSSNYWQCYRGEKASTVWWMVNFVPRSILNAAILSSTKLKDSFKRLSDIYNV